MKPCRKQRQTTAAPPIRRSADPPAANVRRYAHPIRTAKSPAPAEEMLASVLEALSRQSEQLDEVLRRLDGDNSDTI